MAGETVPIRRRARVVHHVPGRMRLRFDRDVDVDQAAAQLRTTLSQRPGVRSVEAHPRTRSVLVSYDAALLDIAEAVEEGFPEAAVEILEHGLDVVASAASGTRVGRGVVKAVGGANARLEQVTGGILDLRDAMPLTLFGLGIRRLLQGGIEPVPWYNLLYYGFSTFSMLHGEGHGHHHGAEPSAIEIVRQRFARGEITRTQYRHMLAELESRGEPGQTTEGSEPSESSEATGDGQEGPA